MPSRSSACLRRITSPCSPGIITSRHPLREAVSYNGKIRRSDMTKSMTARKSSGTAKILAAPTGRINSHNEWDKLREVIVGTAEGSAAVLTWTKPEPITDAIRTRAEALAKVLFPNWFLEEIREDLASPTADSGRACRPSSSDSRGIRCPASTSAPCRRSGRRAESLRRHSESDSGHR